MNLERLKKQLIIDEGCKLQVYRDSLGFWTVGIGHLLTKKDPELMQLELSLERNPKSTMTISQARCDELFKNDIDVVVKSCKKIWSNFDNFLDEVQEICANMVFNLGETKIRKLFPSFVDAVTRSDYKRAALEMQFNNGLKPESGHCAWYLQTKGRAKRLVARMEALS
jgi:lysozyme